MAQLNYELECTLSKLRQWHNLITGASIHRRWWGEGDTSCVLKLKFWHPLPAPLRLAARYARRSSGTSIRNWMRGNTHILLFKCKNIDEMRAKRAAKCALTENLKCRNDKILAKPAENKVKPSNIENNLVKKINKKYMHLKMYVNLTNLHAFKNNSWVIWCKICILWNCDDSCYLRERIKE